MNQEYPVRTPHPYPVFLRLAERSCLVVGGGKVAFRKALDLAESGAQVTVVAEAPSPGMEELAKQCRVVLERRPFEPDDLKGMFLVFAATDDRAVNASISELARTHGVLVNAVDDPDRCDFISGAVVKRGPLRIAVSTSGCCPAYAARVRREIEEQYDESRGEFLELAGEIRESVLAEEQNEERRKQVLSRLADEEMYTIYLRCGKERVWEEIRKIRFSL